MHYVYKITNIANGMCYIGRTEYLGQRWAKHLQSPHCQEMKNDMDSHGLRFFVFQILRECETYEKALYAEERIIKRLNTLWPNGYNKKVGGSPYVDTSKMPENYRKSIHLPILGVVTKTKRNTKH